MSGQYQLQSTKEAFIHCFSFLVPLPSMLLVYRVPWIPVTMIQYVPSLGAENLKSCV